MLKVSYLVPLYNKEDYIEECIDSILQEETENLEIEICIVDDGSLDHSLQIVQNRYGDDQRVKIASFPVNKGKNAACNKAFEMSTGDYICLFGADDVVVSGRTKLLLDYSIKMNGKAIYGGLIAKDGKLEKLLFSYQPQLPSFYKISIENTLGGGLGIIPRIYFKQAMPIPAHLKYEDWWLAYQLVRDGRVEVIDSIVTLYRIHGGNDSGNNDLDNHSAVEKNYKRDLAYITEFEKIDKENIFLKKALALRKSFLGEFDSVNILYKPFDHYSFRIIIFRIFGSKFIYKIGYMIKFFKNRLR